MDILNENESRLLAMAQHLLAAATRVALAGGDPESLAEAEAAHEERGLFPRIVVSSPHGGGAVRLELNLHDQTSDAAVVRLLALEATEGGAPSCHH